MSACSSGYTTRGVKRQIRYMALAARLRSSAPLIASVSRSSANTFSFTLCQFRQAPIFQRRFFMETFFPKQIQINLLKPSFVGQKKCQCKRRSIGLCRSANLEVGRCVEVLHQERLDIEVILRAKVLIARAVGGTARERWGDLIAQRHHRLPCPTPCHVRQIAPASGHTMRCQRTTPAPGSQQRWQSCERARLRVSPSSA